LPEPFAGRARWPRDARISQTDPGGRHLVWDLRLLSPADHQPRV
jgi:hypothetical protein